jgi:hypothetical protein
MLKTASRGLLVAALVLFTGCTVIGPPPKQATDPLGVTVMYPFQEVGTASDDGLLTPGVILRKDIVHGGSFLIQDTAPNGLKLHKYDALAAPVSGHTQLSGQLTLELGANAIKSLGELKADLAAASSTDYTIDFGTLHYTEVILGDLLGTVKDPGNTAVSPQYRKEFNDSKLLRPELHVVTRIAVSDGLTYTVKYSDKQAFNVKLPEIAKALNASLDVSASQDGVAVFKSDPNKHFVVGAAFLQSYDR